MVWVIDECGNVVTSLSTLLYPLHSTLKQICQDTFKSQHQDKDELAALHFHALQTVTAINEIDINQVQSHHTHFDSCLQKVVRSLSCDHTDDGVSVKDKTEF